MDAGQSAEHEQTAKRYEQEAENAARAGQGRRSRQLRESARAARRLSREQRAQQKAAQGDPDESAVRRWLRRFGGS
jgi:hypothetical protein